MRNIYKLLLVLSVCLPSISLNAQKNFWKLIPEEQAKVTNQKRTIIPKHYNVLSLDTAQLLAALQLAPKEFSAESRINPFTIAIPMPNGTINHFNIVEYSMMEPGLADKFPEIKTYSGQGIEDRTATIKIDWTLFGFHAMILSPVSGSVWIDPYARGTKTNYISYYKKDLTPRALQEIGVLNDNSGRGGDGEITNAIPTSGPCLGATLRSYRLAVACTGEYAVAVGGTTAALLHSAIVTTVNRVNGVYEKEVTIRLVLIANNNLIEFLNPATDPFAGNSTATTLIVESQTVINSNIGAANYDIGHTFSTGGGGLAGFGVVCTNSQKASGITGSPNPVGDAYDIDFVAHEIGHQFGGRHTFNAATGNCSGNGSAAANAEPGSGSTIMGYAGICTTNDLQPNSDPQFQAISFNELGIFSRNNGGSTCGTAIATGNTPPVVNAGADYTIPISTPFMLTGSASDINGDLLTYSWEQIDVGGAFGNWNAPAGVAPLFRSFAPQILPSRTFPRMSDIANNITTIGEIKASYVRDINFRLTARDNRAGGAGICFDQMKVTTAGATAFTVTSQAVATNWVANGSNTAAITWNVAGTTAAPYNTSNVSILFSTDGGLTFPYTLINSTANDGSENIIIPAQVTSKGRIMVKSIGNIFFNINSVNISITSGCGAEGAIVVPAETVIALAGNAALNLGLSPQYSSPLIISGTLVAGDPTSSLALLSTVSGSCANFGGNVVKYQVFSFSPSITATYTFTLTAALGTVMNLYSNSFNPASPCTNFLQSNLSYDGVTPTASSTYSLVLTAGNSYAMAITGFSSVQPTLPNPFSVAVSSASPAGGVIFSGGTSYFNPGASYNYLYVIVNTATGIITAMSSTANLTNTTSFPAGTYAVYGLSYLNTVTTLPTYVGGSLSNLITNIFANPGTLCANFSKNLVTVIITSPVPTAFLDLTARKEGAKAILSWKTASEQNSHYFNIQRSADGINFNANIGDVNAAGNSNSLRNYSFEDQSPLSKWNYYRIEEVDFDGTKTFSNIAAVNFDKSKNMILLYPNPTSSQLNLEYNSSIAGSLILQFIDSKGALVITKKVLTGIGRTVMNIDVSKFANAVYLIRYVEPDGKTGAVKFIKK